MASRTPNISVLNFFKEARAELTKVTWPTRAEATRYTIIVLIAAVISGVVLAALDFGFNSMIKFLLP